MPTDARTTAQPVTGSTAGPDDPALRAAAAELTPNEVEVLRLLAGALSDREVADRLAMREVDVSANALSAVRRLGAPDRATAILRAIHFEVISADALPPARAAGQYMTRRQKDVLPLMAAGLIYPQISRRLGIAEATVRGHARSALWCVGASTRHEGILLAARTGLVTTADAWPPLRQTSPAEGEPA
ncbi:LuxR C-terminal-related transcriptional regulator [Kitasatospora sp. NPDC101801]|uniref:LuxR C-terminal-related transcriptional regulator n=1 Tax=Kitasatospora sp. NPDC101801 TaxID=3364103 RepID=UPI0037F4CC09